MAKRLLRSLTPAGRLVAGLALFGYAGGVMLGWKELTMLGFGGLVALVIGALFVARPVPLTISRTLHPQKVTVGGSALGVVEVRNATRRAASSRSADDRIGDVPVRLDLPRIAPGERHETPYTVHGRTRGLLQVGPVSLSRTDPLRLFRAVQSQGSTEYLWVRPRVHPMRAASTGWAKDQEGPTSDLSPRGSAAFHALREYQRGDDYRHVHWRTSARTNRLMVRHFVDTRLTKELVILDTRNSSYRDGGFEEAVEAAASITRASEVAGREAILLLPGNEEIASTRSVLDRLTLVTTADGLSVEELFRVSSRGLDVSGIVVISGDADASELVSRARLLAHGRSVIVVRCRPKTSETVMSIVGGCAVLDTPSAASLAAAWSQAVARV